MSDEDDADCAFSIRKDVKITNKIRRGPRGTMGSPVEKVSNKVV
jgi:hypothetical protein